MHQEKALIKKLDLSAEQQVQIDALKAQAKEQNQILRESMKKFKTEEKAISISIPVSLIF